MTFYSFLKSDILKIIPLRKTLSKLASTQAKLRKPLPMKNKKTNLYTPNLNTEILQNLTNICAVTIAIGHLSWAKISISNLTIDNWGAHPLPSDLLDSTDESRMLILANEIKHNIPISDLYVMENQKKWTSSLNEIYLRAMLIVLLPYDKDVAVQNKIIVQKTSVLNNTYKLLVGQERKSARPIVSNLLHVIKNSNGILLNKNENSHWSSQLKIQENQCKCFLNSAMEAQESLSLALLIALSFLNKNYF